MTVEQFYSNPHKWTQHHFVNFNGQRCLEGAISFCYDDEKEFMLAREKLRRVIRNETGLHSIIRFNDNPGRSFEDIIRVVKAAGV